MRVLMTGGTGLIGQATSERLLQNGWDVRVLGMEPAFEIKGAEYAQCNILNYDDLLRQMRGCDAVIHLAALRAPSLAPGHEVFRVNVAGTFNVFEAAAAVGIRRVVQASSINAIGCFYSTIEMKVRYLPVDEAHPIYTTDPYSFSKEQIENIGAYYGRREGISSVAMRFPGVYRRGSLQSEGSQHKRELVRHLLDDLLSQPESERRARIDDVRQRTAEYRRQRPYEFQAQVAKKTFQEDPLFWIYSYDRFNFWACLDERDAAQSLEKALTADYEGAHPLFINDDHNSLGCASAALADLFFPGVDQHLSGSSALVSIEKARSLIGFEPEYSIGNLALYGDHHD